MKLGSCVVILLSPMAFSACERKEITPIESKVRPQYEAQFRQRNQALISQVKPLR